MGRVDALQLRRVSKGAKVLLVVSRALKFPPAGQHFKVSCRGYGRTGPPLDILKYLYCTHKDLAWLVHLFA